MRADGIIRSGAALAFLVTLALPAFAQTPTPVAASHTRFFQMSVGEGNFILPSGISTFWQ
jgi:hypothetical protein